MLVDDIPTQNINTIPILGQNQNTRRDEFGLRTLNVYEGVQLQGSIYNLSVDEANNKDSKGERQSDAMCNTKSISTQETIFHLPTRIAAQRPECTILTPTISSMEEAKLIPRHDIRLNCIRTYS